MIYEDGRQQAIYGVDWNKVYTESWLPLPSKTAEPMLKDSLGDYHRNGYDYTFKAVGGTK